MSDNINSFYKNKWKVNLLETEKPMIYWVPARDFIYYLNEEGEYVPRVDIINKEIIEPFKLEHDIIRALEDYNTKTIITENYSVEYLPENNVWNNPGKIRIFSKKINNSNINYFPTKVLTEGDAEQSYFKQGVSCCSETYWENTEDINPSMILSGEDLVFKESVKTDITYTPFTCLTATESMLFFIEGSPLQDTLKKDDKNEFMIGILVYYYGDYIDSDDINQDLTETGDVKHSNISSNNYSNIVDEENNSLTKRIYERNLIEKGKDFLSKLSWKRYGTEEGTYENFYLDFLEDSKIDKKERLNNIGYIEVDNNTVERFDEEFLNPYIKETASSSSKVIKKIYPDQGKGIFSGGVYSPSLDELWSAIWILIGGTPSTDNFSPVEGEELYNKDVQLPEIKKTFVNFDIDGNGIITNTEYISKINQFKLSVYESLINYLLNVKNFDNLDKGNSIKLNDNIVDSVKELNIPIIEEIKLESKIGIIPRNKPYSLIELEKEISDIKLNIDIIAKTITDYYIPNFKVKSNIKDVICQLNKEGSKYNENSGNFVVKDELDFLEDYIKDQDIYLDSNGNYRCIFDSLKLPIEDSEF